MNVLSAWVARRRSRRWLKTVSARLDASGPVRMCPRCGLPSHGGTCAEHDLHRRGAA